MQFFNPSSPDNRHYEALIDLLLQEEAIYRELTELLDEEREAMLRLAVERLGEIVSRKETLGLRIKALDESRKVLARRLGTQLGLATDQVTVTNLCGRAPRSVAERLETIGRRLRRTVTACQEKNAYNARAATRGMELVASAIGHLIAQADPAGKVYQATRRPTQSYATLSKTSGSGWISRRV
jgi:flagellar biosynthesis/type III secretory pathway chaperone